MSGRECFNVVIVRFSGEIGIKGSWTRRHTELRLLNNIRQVLRRAEIPFKKAIRRNARIIVETEKAEEAASRLSRVFGVSSTSPASETTSSLDDIVRGSLQLAGYNLKKGVSFAVKCKRTGNHPYTSMDVCRRVGAEILEAFPELDLRVDLEKPEFTLGIEVRDERAYIYTEVIKGVGGFPVGTQPPVIGLIDGGFKSLVASWMIMKRGCRVVPLHVEYPPLTNGETKRLVVEGAELLFEYSVGFPRKLYTVKVDRKEFPEEADRLLFTRLIYRIAEAIARKEKAEGIVTGEMLNGEENTLDVICMLDKEARSMPVYRPLIGLSEAEVREKAEKMGIEVEVFPERFPSPIRSVKVPDSQIEEIVTEALKNTEVINL